MPHRRDDPYTASRIGSGTHSNTRRYFHGAPEARDPQRRRRAQIDLAVFDQDDALRGLARRAVPREERPASGFCDAPNLK